MYSTDYSSGAGTTARNAPSLKTPSASGSGSSAFTSNMNGVLNFVLCAPYGIGEFFVPVSRAQAYSRNLQKGDVPFLFHDEYPLGNKGEEKQSTSSGFVRQARTENSTSLSVSDKPGTSERAMLTFSRNILGLTLSDLASILGLSRPTVYSYLKGASSPTDANAQKIRILYTNAIELKKNVPDLKSVPFLLKRRVFNGESLFDALCSGKPIGPYLPQVSAIQKEEARVQKEIAMSLAKKPLIPGGDSVSPVLYKE